MLQYTDECSLDKSLVIVQMVWLNSQLIVFVILSSECTPDAAL